MRLALGVLLFPVVACRSSPPPPPVAPEAPVQAPAPSTAVPLRDAQVVNATILANECQALGVAQSKLAEAAMYRLVEGCSSVPGGVAQFEATLQPGGRVEIHAAAGQPDMVPICILKHALTHTVPLTKPCHLDVKI